MSGRSAFRSICGRLMTSRSSTERMSKTMYVAGSVFARYSMLIFPLARSRSCNFSKLGSAPFITTISPSRIASFLVWTFRSGYRSSMKFSRRFWNRRPLRTKARARVPSHFSSKMWSGESNGVSRLSASIGLITCVYGSKDGIRSAGLRGLEARLQRGHQVLRRLRLDLRDRGQLFALDLRLDQGHERVPIAVPELRGVEFRRQRADQLEREFDLRRAEVVVPLPEERRNLLRLDEPLDLERLGRLERDLVEVLVLQDDVLPFRELVALHHLLLIHGHVVFGADVRPLEGGHAGRVERREGEVLALRSSVQLDGDVHESERNRAAPQGSSHGWSSSGIETKDRGALNDLSAALTLFKVDLHDTGRLAECPN